MKMGKILAIILGLLCVVGIVFIMNQTPKIREVTPKTEVKMQKDESKTPSLETKIKQKELEEQKKLDELEYQKANLKKKEQFKGVSSLYRVSCAPCHGLDGKGEIAPIIAGQSKEQILKSLNDFKTHDRNNTLMTSLLKNISSKDLEILASEISEF